MKKTIEINNHKFTGIGLLLCACFLSSLALGEVTLDGSVGPAGALTGPDYKVTENLGKRAGSNLFHSFGRFNLNTSESATFSGSTGIKNVISRVTGGQASNIDGTLRVSIPNANLYLLNPAGVIFGQNAKLDVPGSFHVSTADYLKFQDGVRFDSGVATAPQVLATAEPEAFGFLGENPAGISLSGTTGSVLEVQQGSTISLIGGDITSEDTAIYAPGGRINLASVGSAGEVIVNESGIQTTSFGQMGDIRISQDPLVPPTNLETGFIISNIDTSDDTAGKIFIRGGQLVMDNSFVASETTNGNGGDIRVGLTGNLKMSAPERTLGGLYTGSEITTAIRGEGNGNAGSIILDVAGLNLNSRTRIYATAFHHNTKGNAGNITINANAIQLQGDDSDILTGFTSSSGGDGDAGNIAITADSLELRGTAFIDSGTYNKGKGGNLTINANAIQLQRDDPDTNTLLTSSSFGEGDAGNIAITADSLELRGEVIINSGTYYGDGEGDAGNIAITADSLELRDKAIIDSSTYNKGNGGDLTINADNLKVFNGGKINSIATEKATGKGGNLTIDVNNILLSGRKTNITTKVLGGSDGGDLAVISDKLELRNGARISSSAGGSRGDGGDIIVESNEIILTNDVTVLNAFGPEKEQAPLILGTGIDSIFFGEDDSTGSSGNVTIKSHNLIASNGASITLDNRGHGKSGDLFVESNEILLTNDPDVGLNETGFSAVLTNSGVPGNSGNLTVKANNLTVENGASIDTRNFGAGSTGNLVVDAKNIILSGSKERERTGIINEVFGTGSAKLGKVSVTADNLKIQNGASVSSRTFGAADGGDTAIAVDNIEMYNNADINASTEGSGNAGNITIKAKNIALSGKGTEVSSEARANTISRIGSGSAGNIAITVSDMSVRDSASISTADFDISSNANEGRSGDIDISLNNILRLENKGIISTQTKKANAGNITINNGKFLWLGDSSIVTSVQNDKGNGGNISITTPIVALDNSIISAQTAEGQGGNVNISGFLFKSPSSLVIASSKLGIDGDINLRPDTNISGSIAVLPDTFLDVSQQMGERCAARSGNNLSGFVLKGRGGAPLSPGDLAPSNFMDYLQTEERSVQNKESLKYYSLENIRNPLYSGQGESHQFASMSNDCIP